MASLARLFTLELNVIHQEQEKAKGLQQPSSPPKESSSSTDEVVTPAATLAIDNFKTFQDLWSHIMESMDADTTFIPEKAHKLFLIF